MRLTTSLVLALSLSLLPACSTSIGRYGEARLLDLTDIAPFSLAAGYGVSGEIRVTPYAGLGVGWAENWRVGLGEQRWGPFWWEKERGFPIWRYYRFEHYLDYESRWNGGDPYWWGETFRKRASSLVIFPGMSRDGGIWAPALPPYFINTPWEWPAWSRWNMLNVEAGIFLGVAGARVAVSPLQVLDFITSVFMWDIASDDARHVPALWPDPAATPTFPDLDGDDESSAPPPAPSPSSE